MSVSARFRDIVVGSPTLRAALDSRWPIRWLQLYAKRAEECVFRISFKVPSVSKADATRRMLSHSERAVLDFSVDQNKPGWNEYYIGTLQTNSPALLSWKVENDWQFPPLTLAPPLVTLCTSLSYLDVNISSVIVEDTFSFPPSLRLLRLHRPHISTSTDRLRRLFAGVPLLVDLEIRNTKNMISPSFTSIDVLKTEMKPLILPALSSLQLYVEDAPMQLVHAISQVLAVPKHGLKIFVTADAGVTALHEENTSAELFMARNLHDYALRFWSQAARSPRLPPATLTERWGQTMRHNYRVKIEASDPVDAGRGALHLRITFCPRPPADMFLPLVTRFKVAVAAEIDETYSFPGAGDWPPPGSLPALELPQLELVSAWGAVNAIQAWVDTHAQHPIVVQFIGLGDDEEMPSLQWRTDWEPLKDIAGSRYITAEAAQRLLPESDPEEKD